MEGIEKLHMDKYKEIINDQNHHASHKELENFKRVTFIPLRVYYSIVENIKMLSYPFPCHHRDIMQKQFHLFPGKGLFRQTGECLLSLCDDRLCDCEMLTVYQKMSLLEHEPHV
jgi:hypothetical protein